MEDRSEYRTALGSSLAELDLSVNHLLDQGFRLRGKVRSEARNLITCPTFYYQTMVKGEVE
jgi:hypothetical protein